MRLARPSADLRPALECDAPFGEGRRFVHNELAVRGRARSAAGIAGVRVDIGPARQAASLSESDPVRFDAVVDTSAWTPGAAVLTVTVVDGQGREAVERGKLQVEPYEEPVSGRQAAAGDGTALHCRRLGPTAPRLPIKIRGWAYSRSGIRDVSVFLDGRLRHEALYGLTRPHIQKALGVPGALECGFYLLLDPFTCDPGDHVVTVVATPKEGPPVGLSRSLACEDDAVARRGEAEPSVPAEPSPRPQSVSLDARTSSRRVWDAEARTAGEARRRWLAPLAEVRETLDAGRAEFASAAPGGRLPYESASFDLVTCFDALDEADDPEHAVAELRRVLRPAGLLIVSWRATDEVHAPLRRSFENVRAYRQHEYVGSLILAEDERGPEGVELGLGDLAGAAAETGATIAVASDGPLPPLPGLALAGAPDALGELIEAAAGWRERALFAEADAAAKLTEKAQAQRAEERAFMFLRAAREGGREGERALERRPLRRLRRSLSRLRGRF